MKNNKGEMTMGMLITVAIAIIIGTTIFTGVVAPNVGTMTQTQNLVNGTYTSPANQASIDLVGQELLSTPVVINASNNVLITSGNYTIGERISPTDGLKRIYIKMNTAEWASKSLKISYDYGAEGYVEDSGGRAVTQLVAVMVALAILGAALGGVYLKDLFD